MPFSVRSRSRRSASASPVALAGVGAYLGQAEIEDLHLAAAVDHDVAGLDVAMDDLPALGGGHAVGDLRGDVHDLIQGERLQLQQLVEGDAVDVLHDDVFPVVLLGDLIDGADVGVVQPRRRLGFAQETGFRIAVADGVGADALDGHIPAQPDVLGQEDLAHAALAQRAHDLEAAAEDRPSASAAAAERSPLSGATCRGARHVEQKRSGLAVDGTAGWADHGPILAKAAAVGNRENP